MSVTDFLQFILHCIATCDPSGPHGALQSKGNAAWQDILLSIGAMAVNESLLVTSNNGNNNSSRDFGSFQMPQEVRLRSHMAILMSEEMYFKVAVDALQEEWSMATCKLINQFGRKLSGPFPSIHPPIEYRKFRHPLELEYTYGIGQALKDWAVQQNILPAAEAVAFFHIDQNQPNPKQAPLGAINSGPASTINDGE